MKPRLNATRAVRELIKAYEPFLATAERRGRRWVIGWGHRATAREGATITPDNAELLLIYDALQAQQAVEAAVGTELPKAARDALASFAASIGLSAFKVSDVARLAKSGRQSDAAAALDSWVRTEVDGRLVVSERLVERRRAEKALFLEAFAAPQEAAPAAAPASDEDEPTLGMLVDVDIAFEDSPATPAVTATAVDPEPVAEVVAVSAQFDDEAADAAARAAIESSDPSNDFPIARRPQAPVPVADDPIVPEAEAATEAEDDTPEFEPPVEEPALSAEVETPSEPAGEPEAEPAPEADVEPDIDRRAQQDAAIKAVMARMTSEIATSVVPAPVVDAEPEAEEPAPDAPAEAEVEADTPEELAPAELDADLSEVRLGFSYMQPARVEVQVGPEEPAVPETPAEEAPVEDAPAPEPEKADVIPTPVYGTVSVATVPAPATTAPPHPAAAPASAPGLSGESEGPDHPEDEDAFHLDEDDDLDPAIVAGPEAGDLEFTTKPQKSANWVFPAMMGVGVVMTGLGGWELYSNFNAYMADGISHSPIGPVVFGSGFLLTVGAAWMTLSRR